jgi:RNA polymerase sigma-70 factor (family 1)
LQQIAEHTILIEIKNGNEQAFENVFKNYYQSLCRYAVGILNDKDEAEELVQNMFVNYWEKREVIAINVSLKSYLFKTVNNLCLNNLKHQKVKKNYEQYSFNTMDLVSKNDNFKDDLQNQINIAIENLPPQCKLIFTMSRFEDLKYREIAEVLDISEKTVENQMGKALRIMREKLSEYLPTIITFFCILIDIKN